MQMAEPVTTTRGTNVVHLFGKPKGDVDRVQLVAAAEKAVANSLQIVPVAVVGAKADLCLMVLGDDLWAIRRFQSAVQHCGIEIVDSYVSVTEVSEYAAGMPQEMLNARLNPQLPPEGLRAFCFYPMSKRRGDAHNWYSLDYDERERLMRQHGGSGRAFKGRILQVVTGSTGLDDWEWGVTLFGAHVDDLKECVYTMRYDEASTLYGEFGPFYTGLVGTLDEVLDAVVAEGAW